MLGDQLVQLFHEFHVFLIILGSERLLCEFNRRWSTSGNYGHGLHYSTVNRMSAGSNPARVV